MAGKYPKYPANRPPDFRWDVKFKNTPAQQKRIQSRHLTYFSDVHGFAPVLTRSPKLKRYLKNRAEVIRSNLIASMPRSKNPRGSRNQKSAHSSVGIRPENPGGWHNNRATYLITDESGRGAVSALSYLAQFEGGVRNERQKGNSGIGAPSRKGLRDKAIIQSTI